MSKNDEAWEKLFAEHEILSRVESEGTFRISAAQIKKFREPRLMTKFDHKSNLPKIFSSKNLSILPITRGDYLISHFDAWHDLEEIDSRIVQASLPGHLQSLNLKNIFNETVALNCAFASGIIADFTGDENIVRTILGQMPSGSFDFKINDTTKNLAHVVSVSDLQLEVDTVFEGKNFLELFAAQLDLSDDFLIQRIYYPYRALQKVAKPIKPIVLVYTDGIFYLREYSFAERENYNSIVLVRQKKYSLAQ